MQPESWAGQEDGAGAADVIGHSLRLALLAASISASCAIAAQPPPTTLAPPGDDPLNFDRRTDAVLQLARGQTSLELFRELVASAVRRHPSTREQRAVMAEARAALSEARERRLPAVDINLSTYQVLARDFSNDPENITERSRPERRTDALVSVQHTLFDFGALADRVAAAAARVRGAAADAETSEDRTALAAIAAWYEVFSYRALVALTEAFAESQQELRRSVQARVTGGLSAPADVPRVDSYIADTMTSLARFRRQLAGAEARFAQLVGTPAPIGLERAPSPPVVMSSSDAAAVAAQSIAPVRAAMSAAEAARQDSEAARAERLPQIGVGVDAGRYGVLENDRDFDIRLRLGLRQRLFGGVAARARQAEARSEAAGAFAERVREEAVRDAEIAWSDVRALEEQLEALETSYIAARKSRDAIVYRFRAGRSSLFDIIAAETTYFNSAAAFVQALTELDIARYVLLSRTGRLLDTLGIEAPLAGTQ